MGGRFFLLNPSPGRYALIRFRLSEPIRRESWQWILILWYTGTMNNVDKPPIVAERVQTGVRIEKCLLKVLKGLAELEDMTLGDLLEGIVLHAFEGKAPFSPETLKDIDKLRSIYGLTLKAADSHQLKERRK